MNILFVCDEYPPGRNGGIGSMVRNLAVEFVRQGHQVFVVGLYAHGYGGEAFFVDEGVKVWRKKYVTDIGLISNTFSLKDKILLKLLRVSGILKTDAKWSAQKLFSFIEQLIKQYKIDIIEIPDHNQFFFQGKAIEVPRFSAPLVVKLNGSSSYFATETNLPINPVANYSESHLLNMADAIASVSVYTKNLTEKIFNLNKPIEILYNSIPVPDLPLRERDDNTIIFTGSLLKKKGIFSLLKAWNRIHEKHPSAQLYIYGKGAIENIPEYVEEKALPTIHFKGHVSLQQLMNVFKSATMAIFPSYSECFAFAPMEAMSMGCPVIFTKRSSGPELITDGENGLLVDPDNIEEIAEKISLLLTQKTLRSKIAENGAKRIQGLFNIKKSVIDHTAFYLDVIQKRKAIEEAELLL